MNTQTEKKRLQDDIKNLKNWLISCNHQELQDSIKNQIEKQKTKLKNLENENTNKNS